jgi:signal transduction histidine kinase
LALEKIDRRRRGAPDENQYELRLVRKDGVRMYASIANSVITDENGSFAGGLILASDITERKKLEAQLAESQRLAAIGETTAMIGHDLRNPLQGIGGTIYLLRKHYESMPEQKKEADGHGVLNLLDMADESVEYMNKIVSDLQNYAAPLRPELTQVNTIELLNEALSAMRIPPTVKISINVIEDLRKLTVDPLLMRRVVTNLATNAIQAMPQGGELKIAAQKDGDDALVTFQDTGVGIRAEDVSTIFTPFRTTKAQGQGLGLAVCKRLVEAHGGNITVNSTVGDGTTFTVRLPISRDGVADSA